MNEIYADGIGRIERMGGIVKLDLVSSVPGTQREDGLYAAEARARLVMHVIGLANLHAAMRDLYRQIEEAGLIAEGSQPRPVDRE